MICCGRGLQSGSSTKYADLDFIPHEIIPIEFHKYNIAVVIPYYQVTILRGAGLKKFFQPSQATSLKYKIFIQRLIVFKQFSRRIFWF